MASTMNTKNFTMLRIEILLYKDFNEYNPIPIQK